ncbi:hypothetical protein SNEBB_004410 [Seison nebaliae]|nr:hypothetical protein SNEBB_004410 [Seison nebaliae]
MPRIEQDIKLDFKDVLIRPKRSTLKSRADVDLHRNFKQFRNSGKEYYGIPIIASNMDTTGTFEVAEIFAEHGLFVTLQKHYSAEEIINWAKKNPKILKNVAISAGMTETDDKKIDEVLQKVDDINYICLDVANGYSEHFVQYLSDVRSRYSTKTIIAGNVVTGEMVEQLILAGADIVKIGIGPGSVCTTRKKTGVGYPQLSAIMECADAAHGLGGHIIADGGCSCPGDIAKAFGAGADFVMLGGMLAGHDECKGDLICKDGKKYKLFYGMSSTTAMMKHAGGVNNYRASEGKTVEVEYRGPIRETILDILGGLRSACTYVGAVTLKQLNRKTTFVRVTQQTNAMFS